VSQVGALKNRKRKLYDKEKLKQKLNTGLWNSLSMTNQNPLQQNGYGGKMKHEKKWRRQGKPHLIPCGFDKKTKSHFIGPFWISPND
jgi:hypothetical protein